MSKSLPRSVGRIYGLWTFSFSVSFSALLLQYILVLFVVDMLEEQRLWTSQLEAIKKVLEEIIRRVSYVEKLFAIKRVGSITIAGFIAEVGDIRRFDSPKQIQHKGRTRISKRGRRKHRKIWYQVMVSLLARNKEFRGIYDHYVICVKNPLKR